MIAYRRKNKYLNELIIPLFIEDDTLYVLICFYNKDKHPLIIKYKPSIIDLFKQYEKTSIDSIEDKYKNYIIYRLFNYYKRHV